ncbi:peptide chain release factor N(5)-glutamine methyltransferase [Candidatus Pelagibacter sp.]|nr:peptide chain release factor N(5)-glutamine methyltransferase [Candidatus Pelagibacter sp.]
MKIENAIEEGYKQLKQNKVESALLDSQLLMSEIIKKDRKFIILNPGKNLKNYDYECFKKLISDRSKGKPVAYLTRVKSFWNYDFFLNDKVLIPRPDSELIVEQVLKIYKNKSKINFLEIGVGSGCLILSILKEKKLFSGTGIDISNHAIKISSINAKNLKIENRIKLFKSDIDNFNLGKYDLIISNPPYIKKLDFKNLKRDVEKFEPRLALDGGLEGLSCFRKIIKKSSELIKNRGKLILEIACDQKRDVAKILRDNDFYINNTLKDLSNNDRCIISTKI